MFACLCLKVMYVAVFKETLQSENMEIIEIVLFMNKRHLYVPQMVISIQAIKSMMEDLGLYRAENVVPKTGSIVKLLALALTNLVLDLANQVTNLVKCSLGLLGHECNIMSFLSHCQLLGVAPGTVQ